MFFKTAGLRLLFYRQIIVLTLGELMLRSFQGRSQKGARQDSDTPKNARAYRTWKIFMQYRSIIDTQKNDEPHLIFIEPCLNNMFDYTIGDSIIFFTSFYDNEFINFIKM